MLDLLTSQNTKPGLNAAIWKIIDVFYPPFCCYCGVIGHEICPDCFSQIRTISFDHICSKCGKPLNFLSHCTRKEHDGFFFQQARSWGEYSGALKTILRRIKYERGIGLVRYLASPVSNSINEWGITFDFIVPVALGTKRQVERGYNQSECIARSVASQLKKPILPSALKRTRETISQVGLDFEQRKQNVKDAFTADPALCKDKNILLLDDITTTFSTLNACALALQTAGAKSVYCFTVARTIFQSEKEKL